VNPPPVGEERQQLVSDTERELMETIPVDEKELRALAQERARQIQEYLVESDKVETNRVYLAPDDPGNTRTNGHRVYMHLQ
jgi:hypothetical protein